MIREITLKEANTDIVERSVHHGVDVLFWPEALDLTVVCQRFSMTSTLRMGHRIYLEVEEHTGRVGAVTVYNYEDVLFAEVQFMGDYLNDYITAPEAEKQKYGVRLFHALLVLASPELGDVIMAAYQVPVWWEVPLKRVRTAANEVKDKLGRDFDAVADFINSLAYPPQLGAKRKPNRILSPYALRGTVDANQEQLSENGADALLRLLRDHNSVEVTLSDSERKREMTIGWDRSHQAPYVTLKGSSGEVLRDFWLEIRKGTEILWAGPSVEGRLIVPPAEVESALRGVPPQEEAELSIAFFAQE
ncbi:MAG TPA: hypothetical protein VF826_02525 [Chloroflexia bacterium]|jgi:hypothetical protein